MGSIDLLIVGPGGGPPGGVSRYVDEQRRRLPDELSVRVFDNEAPSGGGSLTTLLTGVKTVVDAVRFPFRRRPDLVHVHTSHGFAFYRASWYVFVAALAWRRPVVVHVHGSQFDEFVDRDGVVGRLQELAFGAADRVIALSSHWSQVLTERVPSSKVLVVPNAVDPGEYDPTYGSDPPRIAFVSNHIERKGVREFVDAIERLETQGVSFRAEVAGIGPLSALVDDLASASENVTYHGYVEEAEKRAMLDRADVYVLPTYAEGLPIALLEGMAAGNAVVTTGVGAIPEVIDHERGRIVPVGDADALADALAELLSDPGLVETMGRRNRATVHREYSWDAAVDKLSTAYRSLAE